MAECSTVAARMQELDVRTAIRRPGIVTFLAMVQAGLGVCLVALGIFLAVSTPRAAQDVLRLSWILRPIAVLTIVGSGVLHLACSTGLWRLKRYGWSLLRVWTFLLMAVVPIGTFIGILLITYLNTPGVRLFFAERPLEELSPEERRLLTRTLQSYAPLVAAGVISVAISLLVVAGVVLSMTSSTAFSTAKSSEAMAVMTMVDFAAAERKYAAANGNRFGTPQCLAAPATCIPGYQGQPFSREPSTLAFQKYGYVFQFFSDETLYPEAARRRAASPDSLEAYALLAIPIGSRRRRSSPMYCVDSSGKIRVERGTMDPPGALPAKCPEAWELMVRRKPSS
jgi:hypothetical protein